METKKVTLPNGTVLSMDDEEWKPIIGYEGFYEISNHGNILSLKLNRLLKTHPTNKKKYIGAILYKNKNLKHFLLHRLVYCHFIGELKHGLVIDHIDGNPMNNHYLNLQQITNRQNILKGRINKGIYWSEKKKLWIAEIVINKKRKYLGSSSNKEIALSIYNKAFDAIHKIEMDNIKNIEDVK